MAAGDMAHRGLHKLFGQGNAPGHCIYVLEGYLQRSAFCMKQIFESERKMDIGVDLLRHVADSYIRRPADLSGVRHQVQKRL